MNDSKSEKYYLELLNFNLKLKNIFQLHNTMSNELIKIYPFHEIFNININQYTKSSSLLFGASTDKHVEFKNGTPHLFISYTIILNVGSSKNFESPTGLIMDEFEKHNYNFYPEFFLNHPFSLLESDVCDSNYECNKLLIDRGIWCNRCFGQFDSPEKFHYIMRNELDIINIPLYSILHIDKNIEPIDMSNPDAIQCIKTFLDTDRKKIELVQSNILQLETELQKFNDMMNRNIENHRNILIGILSLKGCDLDSYCQLIEHIDSLTMP